MRRTLSAIFIVLSIVTAFAAFGVNQGTSWTYQGQLRRSGAAYTGTCNFQFSLWDAVSAGQQAGSTQSINSVSVANGLFTVALDFGDGAAFFTGSARWLQTGVQCSGDGGFTSLDPRQSITAAPYALSLRPGATINGVNVGTTTLTVNNLGAGGIGVSGSADGTGSAGVYGSNVYGAAIWGLSAGPGSAIYGQSTSDGLAGEFDGPVEITGELSATGIQSANAVGVRGTTTDPSGYGIYGIASSANGIGVRGFNALGDAIRGEGANGVHGISSGNTGTVGVRGEATGTNSIGVYGSVSGFNTAAVLGINSVSPAIWGQSTGAGPAIYGQALSSGRAGEFAGSVNVQGTLTKAAGSFRIDHPLDPANKFLSHSFVESPDMKNIYDGNVTTDASGSATITLPDYFEALNRDFRYQLTVLGQFAQAIISRKIAGNSFEIRTDKPGVEVSWQVTGIRQDAYAQEHSIVVEEFKPAEQQGMYLYPAGFGAGEEKRIGHLKGPVPAPGAQEAPAAGSSDQARSK